MIVSPADPRVMLPNPVGLSPADTSVNLALEQLEQALEHIAASAAELDANPRFPSESFESLRQAGVLQLAADRERCDLRLEIGLIRAVARADASTARILDGHFNGVERLALGLRGELRARELEKVARGLLIVGVWGADPAPDEGPPAAIGPPTTIDPSAPLEPTAPLDPTTTIVAPSKGEHDNPRQVLNGVKTFCSGAGGIQRALVVARDENGARRLVYADVSIGMHIDRSWYRASGLRSSESHRVEFRDTPVLAVLGGEDELMREPWLSRDAVRTAATWAGIADCILFASVDALVGRPADELRLHALGRMRVAQASIDRWLEHCALRLQSAADLEIGQSEGLREGDGPHTGTQATQPPGNGDLPESSSSLATQCRIALADSARVIAAEAARVCGSRALVGGGTLDRARRDLDLFLLQHRLDPKLVELGARTLDEHPQ
jgi:alkylation response protein AidB-like acyl-CoA dehydrogenase